MRGDLGIPKLGSLNYYENRDPGPHSPMKIGTWGPQFGGSPYAFSHDTVAMHNNRPTCITINDNNVLDLSTLLPQYHTINAWLLLIKSCGHVRI